MATKKRVPKPSQSPLHIPRTRSAASPFPGQITSTKPDGKGGVETEKLFPEHLFPPSKRDVERRHCIPLNPDGSVLDPAAFRSRGEVPADPPPPDPFREKLEACTKAIAELAAFLLSSTRPNRFSEASRVALLARQLAISTASRAKDLPLGNGAGLMAYPVQNGGVVEGPIFADEVGDAAPRVGAGVLGAWGANLAGPDGFMNPNDAGINQRDALLSMMTSLQAQGEQARANTRRALAGELEDLTRVRDQLAERLDAAEANVDKDHIGVAKLRRRLETLDKRIARLFAQIEADPADVPAPAPAVPVRPGDRR